MRGEGVGEGVRGGVEVGYGCADGGNGKKGRSSFLLSVYRTRAPTPFPSVVSMIR